MLAIFAIAISYGGILVAALPLLLLHTVAAAVASATAIATRITVFLGWSLEFGSDQFLGQAGIGSVGQHRSVSDVLLYCNVFRV